MTGDLEGLSVHDLPLAGLEVTMNAWVEEALELRHGVAGDPEGSIKNVHPETPVEILQLLRRVRTRADRVDGLLSAITRARTRLNKVRDEAAFTAEARVIGATSEGAKNRREFSSGNERQADAKLAAFNELRAQHQARTLANAAQGAYDVINQVSWQLGALRRELTDQIRALQFESSLER